MEVGGGAGVSFVAVGAGDFADGFMAKGEGIFTGKAVSLACKATISSSLIFNRDCSS